ncbi:MAG: hypothetical protein HZB54_06375 [Deltaproteobacteria bacterium]|nr:hypothetical protein [Deltaproteobacteria bacterium]
MRCKESLHDEKPLWYEESVRKEVAYFIFSAVCSSIIILSSEVKRGEDFLLEYWKRPIPPQTHRNVFSSYPEDCAQCHKEQYNDWKRSLHSKAVGPGLIGQLRPSEDPYFAISCYLCHAPMEDQSEMKEARGKRQEAEEYIKNPSFDNKLKLSGVSCSVCHLREGKMYGPPARKRVSSKQLAVSSKKQNNHNGFVEKDFFEKAEFCAACHQLNGGYELNGKLLVNTYREWEESFYGKNNIICQNCHMPDRQHLWRGIHDPDMVKKGITIDARREDKKAKLTITNAAVGHLFPTYATPLIVIKGFMLDKKGRIVQSSLKKAYIGRRVSLDLSEEFFDTRVAPQKTFEFDYTFSNSYNNHRLVFEVWIYPDEFYNRFYKALLKNKDDDFKRKEIAKALKITEGSGYRFFREVL